MSARTLYQRHRTAATAAAAIAGTTVLAIALAAKGGAVVAAFGASPAPLLAVAVALQLLALLVRAEAWRVCIAAAGGTVSRRHVFRAASMSFVGSLLNAQVGVAARIAALRRSDPGRCPRAPALAAAELPIVAVEAIGAAIASFTLVGPLGLPLWAPVLAVGAVLLAGLGLRALSARGKSGVWSGLAVMRSLRGNLRVASIVLVAIVLQIARNWVLLHAAGVNASVLDATAVLIAMVTLAQLPLGAGTGAAATVLILGPHGVAAVAAAGLMSTATGTVGGLLFAAWMVVDRAWCSARASALRSRLHGWSPARGTALALRAALAALPDRERRGIELAYFGGLSHLQIARALGV